MPGPMIRWYNSEIFLDFKFLHGHIYHDYSKESTNLDNSFEYQYIAKVFTKK